MKWLPDMYRGELYDFKNKKNELPISPGILCMVAYSRSPRLLVLKGLRKRYTVYIYIYIYI